MLKYQKNGKRNFNNYSRRYDKVFSNSSADIGKTPIVQMEIDTGDNPPISQRPYSLALKHVEWVRQEIEALERGPGNNQECITLG